jgi:hypothetical protein
MPQVENSELHNGAFGLSDLDLAGMSNLVHLCSPVAYGATAELFPTCGKLHLCLNSQNESLDATGTLLMHAGSQLYNSHYKYESVRACELFSNPLTQCLTGQLPQLPLFLDGAWLCISDDKLLRVETLIRCLLDLLAYHLSEM